MRPLRSRSLLGSIAIACGVLVAGVPPATTTAVSATWDSHLDLEWTLIRDHKLMTGPLATGPNNSVMAVVPRNDYRGFALRRMSRTGGDLWVAKWVVGDGGPLRRLTPEALAVSRAGNLVVVAGRGSCRSETDALRDRGPVFIRAYTLGGRLRWTRWIGDCPVSSTDHRPRILSVSGADAWRDRVTISYTQGNSGSSGVHHRRGHVASLTSSGDFRWRTRLSFPSRVKEVVTHDVTAGQSLVATSGEVIRSDSRGSFVIGLSPRTGAVRWRDVIGGRIVDEAMCLQSLDSVGRTLYVAGPGRGDRGILESRTRSGEIRWRVHVPPCVEVSALQQGGALWSGIAWGRPKSPIVFGRQLVGGAAGWRQEWALPDGRWPAEPVFDADDRTAIGTASLVSRATGNSSIYLWSWRWR